jgi:hypothetical protein
MISDIRVQLILMLFGALFVGVWLLPDRVMRAKNNEMNDADFRILARILAGAVPFAFMAALPSFYHHVFSPLPTGAAASGNFWVWLTEFHNRSRAFGVVLLSLYVGAGLVWAIVHFWLYARRLGQFYVMERGSWLQARNRSNLDGLSADERKDFQQVLAKVKTEMLYDGEFPLQPLQQKRFFIANAVLWPVTLAWYLFADMSVDVARYVWFALRNWVHRRWEEGMADYLSDDKLAREYLAALNSEKTPA